MDEESWLMEQSTGPLSHCSECKAVSPFPDLWLRAVKAVTILYTQQDSTSIINSAVSLAECMSRFKITRLGLVDGEEEEHEIMLKWWAWLGDSNIQIHKNPENVQVDTRWPWRRTDRRKFDQTNCEAQLVTQRKQLKENRKIQRQQKTLLDKVLNVQFISKFLWRLLFSLGLSQ